MTGNFSTQLRAWLLIAGLSGLLLGIGAVIGGGALWLFVVLTVVFNVAMYWFSDKIALKVSRAQPVSEQEAPQLYADVQDLTQRARAAHAEAVHDPERAAERVRCRPQPVARGRGGHAAGLMQQLPREQVRGVLAHELAHVKNRDILVMTIAAVIAGAISAIANMLQWSLIFGGGDDDDSPLGHGRRSRHDHHRADRRHAAPAGRVAPARVPRGRDRRPDRRRRRDPLADALETLDRRTKEVVMPVNPAAASLYIVNPLAALGGRGALSLFSTHPPMAERVRRLRELDRRLTGRIAA